MSKFPSTGRVRRPLGAIGRINYLRNIKHFFSVNRSVSRTRGLCYFVVTIYHASIHPLRFSHYPNSPALSQRKLAAFSEVFKRPFPFFVHVDDGVIGFGYDVK